LTVQIFNPLTDERWPALLERHPHASVFHTRGWLRALQQTYGYKPVVFTTSAPSEELQDGIVCCRVESWLSGRRLVSLPFSDHCEPLADSAEAATELLSGLRQSSEMEAGRLIELRPQAMSLASVSGFAASGTYWLHELDLNPGAEELFGKLHKDGIQRKVKRAEREGLLEERGRAPELLRDFYALVERTRRRHQLPPQPLAWFRNLVECMGEQIEIRVARHGEQPVASVLTLRLRDTLVYKYGASDERFHNLGGMPFLFWRTIEDARAGGARLLDLGRTDLGNDGLATFKDRLGATRREIRYWKSPVDAARESQGGWKMRVAKRVFRILPAPVARAAGSFLYRHIG
jgi:hypothetical protein